MIETDYPRYSFHVDVVKAGIAEQPLKQSCVTKTVPLISDSAEVALGYCA
jgi:hypothetical protein